MKKATRKVTAVTLAVISAVGMTACSGNSSSSGADASSAESGGTGENGGSSEARYTYATVSNSVSTWSPTDWEMSSEFDILGYTSTVFYGFELNEAKDNYEIVPAAASAMPVDVTAEYAGNEIYGVPADAAEGYAWKIDLKENLRWRTERRSQRMTICIPWSSS